MLKPYMYSSMILISLINIILTSPILLNGLITTLDTGTVSITPVSWRFCFHGYLILKISYQLTVL